MKSKGNNADARSKKPQESEIKNKKFVTNFPNSSPQMQSLESCGQEQQKYEDVVNNRLSTDHGIYLSF